MECYKILDIDYKKNSYSTTSDSDTLSSSLPSLECSDEDVNNRDIEHVIEKNAITLGEIKSSERIIVEVETYFVNDDQKEGSVKKSIENDLVSNNNIDDEEDWILL